MRVEKLMEGVDVNANGQDIVKMFFEIVIIFLCTRVRALRAKPSL